MAANDDIRSFDEVLDRKYGMPGTPQREAAEEEAFNYYSGVILRNARKQMHLTQGELAKRLGTDTSYISRIETGALIPSVGVFFRIANALGCSVELVPGI